MTTPFSGVHALDSKNWKKCSCGATFDMVIDAVNHTRGGKDMSRQRDYAAEAERRRELKAGAPSRRGHHNNNEENTVTTAQTAVVEETVIEVPADTEAPKASADAGDQSSADSTASPSSEGPYAKDPGKRWYEAGFAAGKHGKDPDTTLAATLDPKHYARYVKGFESGSKHRVAAAS